jgi:Spy/CpxP family protein refolding chaperone
METYHKNKALFWIMMFLILVNLSALATYFLFPRKATVVNCAERTSGPGCALHAELDLTEVQLARVEVINTNYLEESGPVSEEIKDTRADVLDELALDEPDTLKLNQYSLELSQLQHQLHRQNMKHYMELKKVCTSDQAMRLSNLYRELYGCSMQGPGAAGKHQHRKGNL